MTHAVWIFTLALLLLAIALIGQNKPRWLALLAILGAVVIYAPNMAPRIRAWNVFHYYLGSKYFDALGYEDLYPCAIWIADERPDIEFGPYVRELHTYRYMPAPDLATCPYQAFTDSRWQQFGDDMAWILARPGRYPTMHEIILLDKGYNMLPSWTAIMEPLANAAPLGSPLFWIVLYADLLVIGVGIIAVWRARGLEVAAVVAIFMITYFGTYQIIDANWAQYVWLGAVLVGLSAWYTGRRGIAGALLATAAALRIFPIFLFLWPVMHPKLAGKRFWAGAGGAGLIWVVIGSFTSRGIWAWPEFAGKMLAHSKHLVIEPLNIGLRNLVVMLLNPNLAATHLQFNQTGQGGIPALDYLITPWAWLLALGLAGLVVVEVRRRREPDFSVGLAMMWALVVLSRYYYQMLAVVALPGNRRHMQALLGLNFVLMAVGPSWRLAGYVLYAAVLGAALIVLYAVGKWQIRELRYERV